LFCFLFLLLPYPLTDALSTVWQSCSTWYIWSFSPGLLKFFLLVSEKHMCI
jgi:hypothetical protein